LHLHGKLLLFFSVLSFAIGEMLDFIYDSLDTVKKLKFPTVKQIVGLTLAIFGLVIVAGAYFIFADTLFTGGYKAFYAAMTDGQTTSSGAVASGEANNPILPALNISGLSLDSAEASQADAQGTIQDIDMTESGAESSLSE
jgi:hypothetical protein